MPPWPKPWPASRFAPPSTRSPRPMGSSARRSTMPPSPSKPRNSARQGAEIYGRRGETLAAWFLRLQGYRILETRYKTPIGEIDLIARRWGTTVFVEVKSRRDAGLERSEEHTSELQSRL